MVEYIALAEKVEDGFTLFFPDFPGLGSAGNTFAQTRKNAREALLDHIELMMDDNQEIPKPTVLDDVIKLPEAKECIPLIIPVIMPSGKSQRVNITLDKALLEALDNVAHLQHKTRSALLAEAAQRLLGES